MNISITARKFKAHDTLKGFINSEVTSLNKFYDDIKNADVVLSYQNVKESIKIAEIVLQVPGQTLTAVEETDDFQKSVSAACGKLERQLKKIKSKQTTARVK